MATIIQDCLRANLDDTLPETIFQRLATSRVDLAFTLLQRLIDVAPRRDDVKGLVDPAWAALHGQASQIASLLVGNDAAYYRTLLRMLYLSLQSHVSSDRPRSGKDLDNIEKDRSDARAKKAKEVEATVLEILQTVVAHGFRSLIVELHENPSRVQATDFVLLIAIMRTCLQIPGVASYSEQLLTYFDDERTAQHASTLLSWSDRLATAKDPIYGEVSMNFLLELSNLPVLAESLVVNGTFAQAATTNLLSMFRKSGGVGPFDEPMRLYNIWARGYLPLVINLLSSVGPPIAAELSTTLSQFEGQLSRASHSLCVKLSNISNGPYTGYLTLTMAAEVHALALITAILNRFRESGSSLGIVAADVVELPWDSSGVREDIETRLQRRNNLRNNIIPTDEHEEAWSRQKPLTAQEGCENRLEEKVVDELRAALSLLGNADW
ncbi:MAG: hypothetical protein LQ340_004227 [Diploschistes diacapsis]|nr:MAG: hypothetical protein LQ340_004227 [Diploschistes diacapsis]